MKGAFVASTVASFCVALMFTGCGGMYGASDAATDASDAETDASDAETDASDAETDASDAETAALYTLGGTVSGLDGHDLQLSNNGTDDWVTLNGNGPFSFPKALPSGALYDVAVRVNPTNRWQTCTVAHASADAGADGGDSVSGVIGASDVTDLAVTCTTNAYDVKVKVTGLAGSGLVLQVNGGGDLSVPTSGSYTFSTQVESGDNYNVSVFAQPVSPWQTCAANGPSRMQGASVVVDVACTVNTHAVGGTLSGLTGAGLVLTNEGGDDLTLSGPSANGSFAFATPVPSGGAYGVKIKTQPTGGATGEDCFIVSPTGAPGTIANADIASVQVSCGTKKLVFVTSAVYVSDMGGLAGADAKCNALAAAANLPGAYMAWLAASAGSPSTRFTQSSTPYIRVDGAVIANNWADLVDGTLANPINLTELGTAPQSPLGNCGGADVWTGLNADGTPVPPIAGVWTTSCYDWGPVSAYSCVAAGVATATTTGWSATCEPCGGPCGQKAALYCFQQ
jgi:hypothetical protein